jgi:hypothetical protein
LDRVADDLSSRIECVACACLRGGRHVHSQLKRYR